MGRKKDISQRPCARVALALLAYPQNSSPVDQALAERVHRRDAQRPSLEQGIWRACGYLQSCGFPAGQVICAQGRIIPETGPATCHGAGKWTW